MKYKALCYISMVLITGASASAIQISQGTDIGLKDVNSTVKIGEDIRTTNLTVYGDQLSLGPRNISFYYKDKSKAYFNLTDYNKSLSNPFSFSLDIEGNKKIKVVLKGFSEPSDSYKISVGDTSKVFETGNINTSFDLDPGKYDFTVDNYESGDDTESSDSGGSTEETTDTSEVNATTSENKTKYSDTENQSRKVLRTVRFKPEKINITLDSKESKIVNLTLRSNLTSNVTGNVSLIGLGNIADFQTSEITLNRSRPINLSFTAGRIHSGVFEGLLLFNSSSVAANASISLEIHGEMIDRIDFRPEENVIDYSLKPEKIEQGQEFLLTVRNSEGDKIYRKKVKTNNNSFNGSVRVESLNTSFNSFILNTSLVDGDPESPTPKQEKTSPSMTLIVGGLTFLILAAVTLGYISFKSNESRKVSNVKREVRNSLKKVNNNVERNKAERRSSIVLNKLESTDKIPDISTFKVNEALKALNEENYEELNAKLLELELLVDSDEE